MNEHFIIDRIVEKELSISVITHGKKGLSHIFSGSIAEDIANHSTLPIITIKI